MVSPAQPEDRQRLRVLIAYSYSMHYRLGVFRALLDQPDIDVTIAAGTTPRHESPSVATSGVAPIQPEDLPELQWHHTFSIGWLRFQPGLLRRSLSSRYDVVVWDPSLHCLTTWLSSVVIRARGQSLLYWGLGWTKQHGRFKERCKVAVFRLAHGFMTYGQRSAELGAQAAYPAPRLYVVGNSLPDHAAAREAAATTPPDSPLTLGVALRLSGRKRVDLLIRAVAALNARGVPTRAIIVGEGPERAVLQSLADELDADVEFAGELYDAEKIAAYYRRIHLTVIPGHAGLTVIQSLMHGRPVITHDNPDNHADEWTAIRAGVSGAFFAEGDLDALVDTILQVREQLMGGTATTLATTRACREDYLEHGSPQAHARRIIDSVMDVVAKRSPRRFSRVSQRESVTSDQT
ncbi:MAG: glycosyltransferase [Ornithinimicrobium sp.]